MDCLLFIGVICVMYADARVFIRSTAVKREVTRVTRGQEGDRVATRSHSRFARFRAGDGPQEKGNELLSASG